jgi:hypothetical protein
VTDLPPDLLAAWRDAWAYGRLPIRPGMRIVQRDGTFPLRVLLVEPGRVTCAHEEHATPQGDGLAVAATRGVLWTDVPDLDDPATRGCLVALAHDLGVVDAAAYWHDPVALVRALLEVERVR